MKYIWILILIVFDTCWLVMVVKDIAESIHVVKDSRRYNSVRGFINCVGEELDETSVGFIGFHLLALFIVSLVTWLLSINMGG